MAHDLRTDPPLTARFTFGLALTTAVFDDWLFGGLDPRPAGVDVFDHLSTHRDLLDAASTTPPNSDHDPAVLQEHLANVFAGVELQLPQHGDSALPTRLIFALVFAVALLDDWLLAGMDPRPSRERLLDELVSFVVSGTTRR